MAPVYNISEINVTKSFAIAIRYKFEQTTNMLTMNWIAIIFANMLFTLYAYLRLNKALSIHLSNTVERQLATVRGVSEYEKQALKRRRRRENTVKDKKLTRK